LGQEETALLREVEAAIRGDRLILPSPPDHLQEIRRLLEDPDAGVERIAAAIGQDPALAARLLKITNSAAYGGDRPLDSLSQAIARLGNRLVATLVTSHALLQSFGAPCPAYSGLLEIIRELSRQVAAWAWVLAREAPLPPAEEALLAGLVHRIGMLPILQCAAHHGTPPPAEAMHDLLEEYHAPVGAMLLAHWRFPPALVTAVGHYRKPPPTDKATLTDLLAAASAARNRQPLPPDTAERLGLTDWPALLDDPAWRENYQHALTLL